MAKIAPSILSADFANLEREVHDIKKYGADWVHVDVMDGLFVNNITIGMPVVRALRRVTDMPLDVHLMVHNPIRYVEEFCNAGADWLTIHLEADTQENTLAALRKIRQMGVHPGLSIKPCTEAEEVLPYLKEVDLIMVMTVDPGFGGQKFIPEQLDKVRTIRSWLDVHNPGCVIEADGGVDCRTAPLCKASGIEILVSGSAYFRAEDKAAYVKQIQDSSMSGKCD